MSWRWIPQLFELDLDMRAYRKAVKTELTKETREAAKKWLSAVLAIVPTWSRASRATFESLAQAVGFNIVYGPQLSKEDRLTLGLSTGRGGLEYRPNTNSPTYVGFFYETDLRYLAYNEYNHVVYGVAPNVFSRSGLTHPTPYHFQDAGQEAFERHAAGVRLPNPMTYLKPKKL